MPYDSPIDSLDIREPMTREDAVAIIGTQDIVFGEVDR